MENFKKSDLKTGMWVQYRDKNFKSRMVILNALDNNGDIDDVFVNVDGFMSMKDYDDDLLCNGDRDCDIIKVFKANPFGNYFKEDLEVLWERKDEELIEIDGIEYSKTTLRNLIRKAVNKEE